MEATANYTVEELGNVRVDLEDMAPCGDAPNRSIWSWDNLDHRPTPEEFQMIENMAKLIGDEDVLAACMASFQLKNNTRVEDELSAEHDVSVETDPLLESARTAADVADDR